MTTLKLYTPETRPLVGAHISALLGTRNREADVHAVAVSKIEAAVLIHRVIGYRIAAVKLVINQPRYAPQLVALAAGDPGVFVQPMLSETPLIFIRHDGDVTTYQEQPW